MDLNILNLAELSIMALDQAISRSRAFLSDDKTRVFVFV
jgi:hypothetical protein